MIFCLVAAADAADVTDADIVDEVAAVVLLALFVANAAAVVAVAAVCDGGLLLAKTGDDSMSLTKFEGKTPILFFKRPRHQPSST